jgi:hypothetical protein
MVWLRLFGFAVLYLLFGGFVFVHALFDQWTYNEIRQHGAAATAHISNIKYNAGALSNRYYVVDLIWLDESGQSRTYKSTLSVEFVNSTVIPSTGLGKRDVEIKYLVGNSYARPLVVGDEQERERIVSNDTRWGLGLFLSSLALLLILYAIRRKWAAKKQLYDRRTPT